MSTASDPPAAGRAGLTGASDQLVTSSAPPAAIERETAALDAQPTIVEPALLPPSPAPAPTLAGASVQAGPVKVAAVAPTTFDALNLGAGLGGVTLSVGGGFAYLGAETPAQRKRAATVAWTGGVVTAASLLVAFLRS